MNVVEYFENETKKSKSRPNIIDKIEGSTTHLKSRTGYQKSCEIFESQLILKSEIIIINVLQLVRFSAYLRLQIRKSSIMGVDQWLDTTCVGCTVLYVTKTVDFACTEG